MLASPGGIVVIICFHCIFLISVFVLKCKFSLISLFSISVCVYFCVIFLSGL